MFTEMDIEKTNDQQWYGVVPDVLRRTKDPDALHVRVGTQNSNALTEVRAQRINKSLANAAIVFITQESLDAFRLVIEQLSQFYKTSAEGHC